MTDTETPNPPPDDERCQAAVRVLADWFGGSTTTMRCVKPRGHGSPWHRLEYRPAEPVKPVVNGSS